MTAWHRVRLQLIGLALAFSAIHSHAAPLISIEPATLSFTGQQYSVVAGQSLVVSNSGDADLNYTIASDVFWLRVANPAGSLPAGQATSHVITASRLGLDALRTYTGHLTLADPSATNNPQLITISLTLSPATPPSRVVLWGNNTYYQTNVPAGLTNAVAIAGGGYHSLAIRSGGGVTAWGTNGYGQTNVPTSLTNAVTISCGWYHSLALKSDGTIAVWGRNIEGQTNLPAGMTNIQALSGGSYHSLAVRSDGTVAAWGFGLYGQTNVPAGLTNVFTVAGGNYHSIALRRDGTVAAWGSDDYGQSTAPSEITNAVAIAGGGYHSLALLDDGTVTGWGRDIEGQTDVPVGLSNVVAISAGNYHSLAFRSDGSVVSWGRNVEGQTNVPASLIHATAASAGGYHCMALAPARALIVSSSHGSPTPGVGTSWPIPDSTLTCSAPSTVTAGGTQYVNIGWSGSGDIPPTGTSNSVSYTVTNQSTITWYWQTNYWLNVYATGGGTVGTNMAWFPKDSNVTFSATNLPTQTFLGWFGNTNGCTINGTDILAPITQARALEARFSAPSIATPIANLVITGQVQSVITDQMLTVSNAGTGLMDYQLDSDAVWLTVTPNTGLLQAGQSTSCVVHVSTRGLDARTYQGNLVISDPLATNSPRTTMVTLSLAPMVPGPSRVVAWGDNSSGQTNVPPALTNAVDAAGGLFHSIALCADGTVVSWGTNTYGQTNTPMGLNDACGIAAGGLHSLALLDDGTVVAWGQNTYGQTNTPTDLNDAVAVAAGMLHSLALRSDGTVAAWGYNFYGQTNVPPGLSNVIAIAGGENHSLALLKGGTVVGWGYNNSGQIDPPASLTNAVAIAAANNYSLALRRDGTVVGWGDSSSGQTNIPAQATNVIAIGAGSDHALALRADEAVVVWGANTMDQTNVPAGVKAFAAGSGGNHSLAVVPTRSLAISSSHDTPAPDVGIHWLIRDSVEFCSITSSVTAGGTQYVNIGWAGTGSAPASGNTNTLTVTLTTDTTVAWLWQTNYQLSLSVVGGGVITSNAGWHVKDTNLTITATNSPGYEFAGWLGDTNDCLINETIITLPMTQARSVSALFVAPTIMPVPMGLTFEGHVYSNQASQTLVVSNAGYGTMNYSVVPDVFWLSVSNSSGSLGTGEATSHIVTVSTRGLEPRMQYGHLAVTSPDATNGPQTVSVTLNLTNSITPVIAWGDNTYNQTNVPANLTNAVAISAGGNHSLALRANGRIAVWGDNSSGQTNIPATVTNVLMVVGGWNHSLALLPNRTVVAWGNNASGQTNVPAGLTNVVDLSGGWKHSLALRSNGTVVAWGNNADGQTNVPPGLSNVVQVSAGKSHSMALRGDGRVVAWGDNSFGQTNVPAALSNVVAIDAGGNHSVALRADGTVSVWGNNASGQTNVSASLTNVIAIDAGADHTMALRDNGRIAAWGDNTSGQTNVPANLYFVEGVSGGRSHSMALVPTSWKVVVTSAYDTPVPPVGTNWIRAGTIQSCSVTSDIVLGGTQYICVGWTGSGNAGTNGGSNSFTLVLTTNSTLTWQWRTNFWLQTATNGTGDISPTSLWCRANSNITLTATPAAYNHFTTWTGDVPVSAVASNPLTLFITAPRYVLARFTNNVTSNGTPEIWLASFGWTTNFEAAATNDADGDGLLTWEEYIADSIPTSGLSLFQMSTASNASGASVQFVSSTGRLYSLDLNNSILTGSWQAVAGQTNVPGNGGTLSLINTNPPTRSHYYRVRVKLP